MNKFFRQVVSIVLCIVLFLCINSCGTLLHPERVNQPRTDRMDTAIVILDGLLCLVFIIPGVVAFVIDIDNRSIYLPEHEWPENRRKREQSSTKKDESDTTNKKSLTSQDKKTAKIHNVIVENGWSTPIDNNERIVVLKFMDAKGSSVGNPIEMSIVRGQNYITNPSFKELVNQAHSLEIYEQGEYRGRIDLKSKG